MPPERRTLKMTNFLRAVPLFIKWWGWEFCLSVGRKGTFLFAQFAYLEIHWNSILKKCSFSVRNGINNYSSIKINERMKHIMKRKFLTKQKLWRLYIPKWTHCALQGYLNWPLKAEMKPSQGRIFLPAKMGHGRQGTPY